MTDTRFNEISVLVSGFLLFMTLAVTLVCFVRTYRFHGAKRFARAGAVIFILTSPCAFCVEHYLRRLKTPDGFNSVFADFTESLPVWLIAAVSAGLFVAGVLTSVLFIRWGRSRLSERSIYDGLDYLPEGVWFSDVHGLPVLVNERMHEILYETFGLATMDLGFMHRRLERDELKPGCKSVPYYGGIFLIMPDGTVWDLRETPVTARGGSYTELLAFDVTGLYRGNEELREHNERLAAVNEQIREYNRNMDRIVREREILNAKIRLHDEFGKSLLAIRSYLSGQNKDRAVLLELLKAPVFLFQNNEGGAPEDDPFALLDEAAHAVGVTLHYNGALPSRNKEVLCVAVHECITNTVKHANGHNLFVKTVENGGLFTVEFTNDGDPPEAPVRETGGLANLRALCERYGCEMRIESAPRFRLILTL